MLECAGTIVIKTIRWKFRTRYRRVDEGGKKWNCKKGKHYHVFSLLQILGSLLLQIQKKQNHERYRKISSLLSRNSSNFKKIHLEETRKISRRESKKNERKEKERKRKGKQKKKKDKPFDPTPEKRKGENTDPFAMHNHAPRPSPRATSSGKPPSSLSKSITASGRVSPPLSPRFPFPRLAPRESTSHLPLPTPLQLDSPTSYSRPAESGSRLIIRRVRLDSTDINEERASERDGDTDRGKKEGGHRSEERIEERRVEGSVQTGDTGISK